MPKYVMSEKLRPIIDKYKTKQDFMQLNSFLSDVLKSKLKCGFIARELPSDSGGFICLCADYGTFMFKSVPIKMTALFYQTKYKSLTKFKAAEDYVIEEINKYEKLKPFM